MRRATAVGLIGLAMVLLSARPASAQWDWFKWIQELSGPGPFELNGVTVTFGCEIDRQAKQPDRQSPAAYRYLFCDKANNWKTVKRFYGVTLATGDGENNLTFPAGLPKLERTTASIFLATGAFRLEEWIDVGSSAGFMRFSGTPEISVTKFVIDPFISVRPVSAIARLAGRNTDNRAADFFARAFEVKGGVIIFPQGFRLSDFGAIGGPVDWEGNVEISAHIGFRITVVF
jgi:hypothetical protein